MLTCPDFALVNEDKYPIQYDKSACHLPDFNQLGMSHRGWHIVHLFMSERVFKKKERGMRYPRQLGVISALRNIRLSVILLAYYHHNDKRKPTVDQWSGWKFSLKLSYFWKSRAISFGIPPFITLVGPF